MFFEMIFERHEGDRGKGKVTLVEAKVESLRGPELKR